MKCLLELFFKDSDLDASNFVLNRLLFSIKHFIDYSNIVDGLNMEYWFTPERVVVVLNIDDIIKYSKKGVKLSTKKEYLTYFLKKHNLNDVDSLSIKNDTYYYDYNINEEEFINNFLSNINNILSRTFSKNYKNILLSLKNIYLNINNECKNILFNNIKSSNFIIINNNEFIVNNPEEYFKTLKDNDIYLDLDERKKFVSDNLKITNDIFINNVLFIKEKPLFLFGKIKFDCNYLFLNILEKFTKDKYVFFIKEDFLYFIFLSDEGVVKFDNFDNEFYSGDILKHKQRIEKFIYKINNKIYNYNKNKKSKEYDFIFNDNRLNRVTKITKFLSLWIPNSNIEEIDFILSSSIYKNSNFIENNTELDLLLKKYFLLQNNKNEDSVNVIIDSLRPSKNSDILPKIPSSIAISIANKIDSIIYYSILIELKKPIDKNIEKNMYNNLLNIIIQNNISLPLKLMLDYSLKNFINDRVTKKQDRLLIKKYRINKNIVVNNILEKIYDKLYYYLINFEHCNETITNLIISSEVEDINNIKNKSDILKIYNKIKNMSLYCEESNFDYLLMSYKRVNNFLTNKKIFKNIIVLEPRRFTSKYEKNIYDDYFKLKKSIKRYKKDNNYKKLIDDVFSLSNSLNNFLNNIYINKVNIFRRKKYIKLLYSIKILYNKFMKFEEMI